ncbi:MAG: hypothetical protein AAB544_04205, partial [Patescibacteria group bacterium]
MFPPQSLEFAVAAVGRIRLVTLAVAATGGFPGISLALTGFAGGIIAFFGSLPLRIAAVLQNAAGGAPIIVAFIPVITFLVCGRRIERAGVGIQLILDAITAHLEGTVGAAGVAILIAVHVFVASTFARAVLGAAIARLSGIFRTVAAYFLLAG